MNHKIGYNKLNLDAAHRKAMIRNQVSVLFRQEKIVTTKAKALETRRQAERLITRAKVDSVHNRRIVSSRVYGEDVVAKLFTDIAPRFKERNGGYTRIIKLGNRANDAASLVVLELVGQKADEKKTERDKRKAQRKAKKQA
jgi:large subunit ribosomal protein L17